MHRIRSPRPRRRTEISTSFAADSSRWSIVRLLVLAACLIGAGQGVAVGGATPARPRVVVSTDIGGTDPDDLQSMVMARKASGVGYSSEYVRRLA